MDKDVDKITLKFLQTLNEVQARWFAGSKAIEFGRGGIRKIYELTGIARSTIIRGIKELEEEELSRLLYDQGRIRKEGGGRKRLLILI